MFAACLGEDQSRLVARVRRASLAFAQTDVGACLGSGADGSGAGALGLLFLDAGATGAQSVHVHALSLAVVKMCGVVGAHRLGELFEAAICVNDNELVENNKVSEGKPTVALALVVLATVAVVEALQGKAVPSVRLVVVRNIRFVWSFLAGTRRCSFTAGASHGGRTKGG